MKVIFFIANLIYHVMVLFAAAIIIKREFERQLKDSDEILNK